MQQSVKRGFALMLALACLAAAFPAAAQESGETRYVFEQTVDSFDARFKQIFDAMNSTYDMGEEPNIENAYEYHLPSNVYAKVLTYEGQIELVLVMLSQDNAADQESLWQYAAVMAAAVGDIPANEWAVLLVKATALTLDAQTADLHYYVAGNVIMICESDPDTGLMYAVIEREEKERGEEIAGETRISGFEEGDAAE